MALGKGLNSLIPQQKKGFTSKRVESTPAADEHKIWYIPLSEITANPDQPRKHFGEQELADLVQSIQKHGVMQPITVTERSDGGYEIIAGERRFRASELAKQPTIPAIVRMVSDQEKLELALIENIQRQQLNPIEEGFAYNRLVEEFGLTQQEVADQVGKSRSAVANTLRLLGLPEEIQQALIDGRLTAGKGRALLSLKTEEEQLAMFASMLGEKISTREIEAAVAQKGSPSRKGSVRRDPNVMAQEELLEESLGTKVRITTRGEKGTIVIEYYSTEELKRLLQELS